MNSKKIWKRIMSFVLAFVMLCGLTPSNSEVANAATTASVSLTSLGRKGTVSFGSKSKTGTWWQMNLGGKKAFCINLGHTCHTGNTYAAEDSYKWNQNTGGEKQGYYAKIIRWYVLDKKRSSKAFVVSQALIWSVAEGRTSESQLKDVIKQVKNNTGINPQKTVNELYDQIFKPSGAWEVTATFWQKTGNSNRYQRLLTVDADSVDIPQYKTMNDAAYYRQRITVLKKDEDGNGLGGIQFTLNADNLDDLYSFSVMDRDGTEIETADDDNETSFSMTGCTFDSGRIAYCMTYRLQSMEYYYYTDAQLAKMTTSEKKLAKQVFTDDLELDEGVEFASDLTKASAEKLMKNEMKQMKDEISNTYTLTEDNTGDNQDIVVDPVFAQGVEITLTKADSWEKNSDGVWPDRIAEKPSEYEKAYVTGITNNYKKASIEVVKTDSYSRDKKSHGEADLDGAQFQLYAEQDCINVATVYNADGSKKTAGIYTVQNGKLETDYLRSGSTYYLKEVKAPTGYTLVNDILPITVDASDVTAEYTKDLATVEFGNQPILGKVALQKYYSDGETGVLHPEANTTFQIWLRDKSYDECDDYERATIKTDENGYGITGDLYYGHYKVHQVDSGDVDAVPVEDFEVEVTENGKVYNYAMNNNLFKAYLKVLKRDGKTEKQVLKPGTSYEIYQVTDEGEELVKQSYSNGNKMETVDTFTTDVTGEIMTVKPLKSGTYRIYEKESADGLHIADEFVEVTINSKADNYESYVDEDGNTHIVVTVTYTNEETYGKLAVFKAGEVLTGWDAENHTFLYEDRIMKGVEFEIYAKGDISTQDNQGTAWFRDGDKVATIVTGEKAEFTSDCNGICNYTVDGDGTVHISLPLGTYKMKETKTLYGYVFPEDNEWDLEFTWENSQDEFVINSTSDTDEQGTLLVRNTLAKPLVELLKEDADSKEGIAGAVFGLYAAADIYNADGEKIVEKDTELTTLNTTEDGTVKCGMSLPLMDEAYPAMASETTGNTAVVETDDVSIAVNSGDYYLKEISVPDSYYLDGQIIPVHLEYQGADTRVLSVKCVKENKQTTNEVDKLSAAGSDEVDGCELAITDAGGKEIVRWISGDKDSVKVSVTEKDGYSNLKTLFDEKGNLHVGGLFHDCEYTLTEKRPADGYVTADSIVYMIRQAKTDDGTIRSIVSVKKKDGTFSDREDDKTVMKDEQTKIRLVKLDAETGQGLPGAKFTVTDSDGKEVMKLTSTEDGVDIIGKLAVGQTYTFTEVSAPKGYKTAKPVSYKVEDSGKVQMVSIMDERKPKAPHIPQTGSNRPVMPVVAIVLIIAAASVWVFRKKRVQS